MSKMLTAMIIAILIEVVLIMFGIGDPNNSTSIGSFFLDPVGATVFIAWMKGTVFTVLVAITVLAYFTKPDWLWRLTIIITVITFWVNIAHLWSYMFSTLSALISDATVRGYITSFLVSPLALYYIWAGVDFVSGKD